MIRGRYRLSGTPGSIRSAAGPICSELPFAAIATVTHGGGPCLQVSRNQHRVGLDSIDNSRYQKILKKRFPITEGK